MPKTQEGLLRMFWKELSDWLSRGRPLMAALENVSTMIETCPLGDTIEEMIDSVRGGGNLSNFMRHSEAFSPAEVMAVAEGEKNGYLDQVVMHIYQDHLPTKAREYDNFWRMLAILWQGHGDLGEIGNYLSTAGAACTTGKLQNMLTLHRIIHRTFWETLKSTGMFSDLEIQLIRRDEDSGQLEPGTFLRLIG